MSWKGVNKKTVKDLNVNWLKNIIDLQNTIFFKQGWKRRGGPPVVRKPRSCHRSWRKSREQEHWVFLKLKRIPIEVQLTHLILYIIKICYQTCSFCEVGIIILSFVRIEKPFLFGEISWPLGKSWSPLGKVNYVFWSVRSEWSIILRMHFSGAQIFYWVLYLSAFPTFKAVYQVWTLTFGGLDVLHYMARECDLNLIIFI